MPPSYLPPSIATNMPPAVVKYRLLGECYVTHLAPPFFSFFLFAFFSF
jgi:hypothetical protein